MALSLFANVANLQHKNKQKRIRNMENLRFDVDYDKFKDNNNGAIVAIILAGITAIGTLCKYGIDAIGNKAAI